MNPQNLSQILTPGTTPQAPTGQNQTSAQPGSSPGNPIVPGGTGQQSTSPPQVIDFGGNKLVELTEIPVEQVHALLGAAQNFPQVFAGTPLAPSSSQDPNAPSGDAATVKADVARATANAFGPDQVQPMLNIINTESGFNPTAANPTSTARGLFQFLDATGQDYGLPADASQAPVDKQIQAGMDYIKQRYGTPAAAWQFHQLHGWY